MTPAAPLVCVVAKRSQYQRHVQDRHDQRAIELLAHHDPVVARWRKADSLHRRTLDQVLEELARLGAAIRLVSSPSERFTPRGAVLVMTVGGDGTLLAASHRVGAQPLLGVNSSPEHSIGYFCAAHSGNLRTLIPRALDGSLQGLELTRMKVVVNDRLRSARVLNEVLFSHRIPAAVSRYILEHDGRREEQRSSGFWIGTAAGSTGAIRSAGGRVLSLTSNKLQLVVREPYTPFGSKISMRRLIVDANEQVTVRTKMDRGVLFLDGPFRKIMLRLGDIVGFGVSDEALTVLGFSAESRLGITRQLPSRRSRPRTAHR
jgi:NAD+ kinase